MFTKEKLNMKLDYKQFNELCDKYEKQIADLRQEVKKANQQVAKLQKKVKSYEVRFY